ncbi:hypothetical protein KEM54_000802 [Ascosphaera aggregata]|nr:hypothetical protein KEM54_000802 [Ascosphaera aggregata]
MAHMIPIDRTFSDGDPSFWPAPGGSLLADDPILYMIKLASMWLKERGELVAGKKYMLDALPEGFALYGRRRQNDPKHVSLALQEVVRYNVNPLSLTRALAQRRTKRHIAFDEEGTSDVFKALIVKLRKVNIDKDIKERTSPDWRAGKEHLELYLLRVATQHAFVPRIGELVLWAPDVNGEIRFNPTTSTFQIFSRRKNAFVSNVPWRAGVVSQVPEDTVYLKEAFFQTTKTKSLNSSGFRIETLPDTNGTDKYYSQQYRYVSLCHMRPISFWQIFLMNLDPLDFHPSIDYAMTVMASLSVLNKHHFRGVWPNATISCTGIYLGSDLIIKGDTVSLVSLKATGPGKSSPPPVTDVMVVSDIEVFLENCDDDLESKLLCEKTSVRLVGKTYTTSPDKAYRPGVGEERQLPEPLTEQEVTSAFEAVGMSNYGPWYRMEKENTVTRVSPDLVLGRLYELEYMKYMFGGNSMSYSMSGILAGREYGRRTDARIPENKEWFFGDTRIETLAVATVNGVEVGKFDSARDLEMLRASLRIVDADASMQDLKDCKVLTRATFGMIGSSHKEDTFETVGKTSTMVASALEPTTAAADSDAKGREETNTLKSEDDLSSAATPVGTETAEMADVADSIEDGEDARLASELKSFINEPYQFIRGGTKGSDGGEYTPHGSSSPSLGKRPRLA